MLNEDNTISDCSENQGDRSVSSQNVFMLREEMGVGGAVSLPVSPGACLTQGFHEFTQKEKEMILHKNSCCGVICNREKTGNNPNVPR